VHSICSDSLLKCPNCPPALETLSKFYVHVAHLAAAQHVAATVAGSAQHSTSQCTPAPSSTSGEQSSVQSAYAAASGGGEAVASPSSHEAILRGAVVRASQSAVVLLNHLMVADPIRSMYWNHRWVAVVARAHMISCMWLMF